MGATRRFFPLLLVVLAGAGILIAFLALAGGQAAAAAPAMQPPPAVQFGPAQRPVPRRPVMAAPSIPGEGAAAVEIAAPNAWPFAWPDPAPAEHLAPAAPGATFTVVNTNDSGAGSLRDAVTQANASAGHDTIQFNLAGCPCVITLLSTLAPAEELTVSGPGASQLSISGNNASRIFTSSGIRLHLKGLTLTGGFHASQGGGAVTATDLTLENVTVSGSNAAFGGGVYVNGPLVITNTVFTGNNATTLYGGGAYAASLHATGSNFLNNTAYTDGGGAYVSGNVFFSTGIFQGNATLQVKNFGGGAGLMAFGISRIDSTSFLFNTTPAWGGGAYLANFTAGTTNHINASTFHGNVSAWGGGGLFQWFNAVFTDTHFINNESATNGGGAYAGYAGQYSIRFTGGSFQDNQSNAGGGLYSDGSFTLKNVDVSRNTALNGGGTSGGGGAFTPFHAYVSDSSFISNSISAGGYGGGLYAKTGAAITDTVFTGNQVNVYSGGGLVVGVSPNTGSANLLRVTFTRNNAPGDYAGGLLSYGATRLTDTDFISNTSYNDGGGAWVGGLLTMTGGTFRGNRTTLQESNGGGGGLMAHGRSVISGTHFSHNTTADWGGGAYLYSSGQPNVLTGTVFYSNTASSGGGGGLFSWYTLTLNAGTVSDNYANWYGGGVYAGYIGPYRATINGGSFQGNSGRAGGGLFSDADLRLNGAAFGGNKARSGNGGGAWTPASARVTGSTFSGNMSLAAGNGGGLDAGAGAWLTDTVFTANHSLAGSGGGSSTGGNQVVKNGTYSHNTAFDDGGGLLAFGTATVNTTTFFSNTTGDLGGGLAVQNLVGSGLLFDQNRTNNCGGGAFANAAFSLSASDLFGNTAGGWGGGMCAVTASAAGTLSQVTFGGNNAGPTSNGGGLYSSSPNLRIFGGGFYTNSAGDLGGAALLSQAAITGTFFSANIAGGRGGGLLFNAGNNTIRQAYFVDNQAAAGGGLAFEGSAGGSLVNSLLAGNTAASGSGRALYLDTSGALSVLHATIAHPSLAGGSGVYLSAGTLTMQNSILSGFGAGVARTGGSATLTNPLFYNNTANTQGVVTVNGAVSGNPAFFNPGAGDYHLGTGSAAFNAGINAGISVDYDGDLRPQGGGFDIGFDEAVTPSGVNFVHNAPRLAGQPVNFNASATFGQGVSFLWNFGDGASGSGVLAAHAYSQSGTYNVTLTASNAAGQNVVVKSVTINPHRLYLPSLRR